MNVRSAPRRSHSDAGLRRGPLASSEAMARPPQSARSVHSTTDETIEQRLLQVQTAKASGLPLVCQLHLVLRAMWGVDVDGRPEPLRPSDRCTGLWPDHYLYVGSTLDPLGPASPRGSCYRSLRKAHGVLRVLRDSGVIRVDVLRRCSHGLGELTKTGSL